MTEEYRDAEELSGSLDFGPEITRPDGSVIKSAYPRLNQFPQYASMGAERGVQLPGPDAMPSGVGNPEQGFDPDGSDAVGVYHTNITGIQLPGHPSQEPGYAFGENTRGLAPMQSAPQGMSMGTESDMAPGLQSGGEMAQGMRVFGTQGSNTAGVQTGDILSVFAAIGDAGGHSPMSGVPGMDSLRGIPLGPGSGIVGGPGYVADVGNYTGGGVSGTMYGNDGDGNDDQNDFSRYPSGSEFQPGEPDADDRNR